ncbi:MAG: hypothetical protein KGY75_03530 [Candidatus Cloacimonetes bacterium]|nr:hypothetical protein [Candidatus Cloacimonadota bacterium]MBS3767180.1 hypothetical protein [Candidatus Cloacimonadota bacterium]
MCKKWGLLSILLFLPVFLYSAFLQLPSSAVIAANANISIFDSSSASIFYNPAIVNSASLTISFHRPFSLSDLKHQNISASYTSHNLHIALGLQQFGNAMYTESTAMMALNYPFTKSITTGISYRFLQKKVDGFANKNAHQLDTGIKIELNKFSFATSFLNLSFSKLGKEILPQECRNSVSYSLYNNLEIAMSLVKEMSYPFSFHFATSYKPFSILRLSSGFQTEPHTFSAGVGIKIYKATFSYAIHVNKILKETHYLSLQYP